MDTATWLTGIKKKRRCSVLFSASVFNDTDVLWAALSSELDNHYCGSGEFPSVDTEIVREQLHQQSVPHSTGSGRIHPRVLKELVDVTAGPLSVIC